MQLPTKLTEEVKKDIHQMRRAMLRNAVFAAAAALALIVTAIAWFVNNEDVGGKGMSLEAIREKPSLFIDKGVTTLENHGYNYTVDAKFSGNLFPISTSDCTNFWYLSDWNDMYAQAVGYQLVTEDQLTPDTDHPDRLNYSTGASVGGTTTLFGNATHTACNMQTYTVYTSKETLDVYFGPDSLPIRVWTEGTDGKKLLNALRVGIKFNDGESDRFIMYSPVKESGKGNSRGTTTADAYYAVSGNNTVQTVTGVLEDEDFVDYVPVKVAGEDDEPVYSGDGKIKLFTADTVGTQIYVYVWLEGTDAQAVLTQSDHASGIKLTLSLIGL